MSGRRGTGPLALALAAGVLLGGLTGCGARTAQAETQVFAMDTVMSLQVCAPKQAEAQAALDEAVAELYDLDRTLSVTGGDSDVRRLNDAAGNGSWVALHETGADVLRQALELCAATGGALDITTYPAMEAWGFPSGDYRVPDEAERAALAEGIDYTQVELAQDGDRARLPQGTALDLGAVGKGYAGDRLAQLLRAGEVTSALLNLGQSTIVAIGSRPDGTPWRIGIQDPAGEDYLGVLELTDGAVGTSGGYQRYFEQDGVRYWHILDPATAAPARSGLASVTVVSPSGLTCDGLSTALFVMGEDGALAFWREHPELDLQLLLVAEDGTVSLTPGLRDAFTLSDHTREVTVLQ